MNRGINQQLRGRVRGTAKSVPPAHPNTGHARSLGIIAASRRTLSPCQTSFPANAAQKADARPAGARRGLVESTTISSARSSFRRTCSTRERGPPRDQIRGEAPAAPVHGKLMRNTIPSPYAPASRRGKPFDGAHRAHAPDRALARPAAARRRRDDRAHARTPRRRRPRGSSCSSQRRARRKQTAPKSYRALFKMWMRFLKSVRSEGALLPKWVACHPNASRLTL